MSQTTESGKKNKTAIIVIIILAVVVIALVGVVAFLLGRGSKEDGGAQTSEGTNRAVVSNNSARVILDEKSADSVVEEMRKQIEEGFFECKMSSDWTFADGNSESKDAYVENSENNTHPIYFDVVLEDTEELIYSSPVIPVGSHLTDFKLDKPLSAGKYRALCKYVLLSDLENQEEISAANFVITITVQN